MCYRLTWICLSLLCVTSIRAADAWKPAAGALMTRWAKDVSPTNVHPEYPRPQMVRESWTNLNGLWDYAIVAQASRLPNVGQASRLPNKPEASARDSATKPEASARDIPSKFDGQILVPFPIESALSGVMKTVGPGNELIYHRTFKTPQLKDGRRLLLHFGAVDWQCKVSVNGKKVGDHTGGYDPFTFDITDALDKSKSEQDLVVSVTDPSDANWQPRGKQVREPKGIWYTPTTGIWQTVWLEEVPNVAIESIAVVPDLDSSSVWITVNYIGGRNAPSTKIQVLDGNREVASANFITLNGDRKTQIKIPNPKTWSPDSPFLYSLRVESVCEGAECDKATSYFAMRKISLGKDKNGVTRLMLNNQPVFHWGPLDQGFWPDGLYTAPTDAAMKYDLEVTKQLGFNMIRKHVKVEPARWYHYCDQMGILVWQDMPSGDKHAPWNPLGGHKGEEITRSQESADNFRAEWKHIMDSLMHFPSIVVWVPFNEAWGQFDTVNVTNWTMKHDPSRLVNCASGGNDFPCGHISDLHRYPGPTIPALEEKRAAVLGEFGGLGLPLEGHTWQSKNNWGYRSFTDRDSLNSAYANLIRRLHPLIGKGLSAAVYTQTTDVEVEVNGFMTYDREVIKLDPKKTASLHARLHQPPPIEIVVVPDSRNEPQTWRYTTTKPADGWQNPDFNDSAWQQGPGGFGKPSTPGSNVRTTWNTPGIWLRRTFDLPAGDLRDLSLTIHHDEDAEVYLNGVQVFTTRGYITDYITQPLDDKALAALHSGKNTLAVHCKQTGGGQYIDVGLSRLEEAKKQEH